MKQYVIVDGSNEVKYSILGDDGEFGQSEDGAKKFDAEKEAQVFIDEMGWNNWAYISEV